MEVFTAHVAMDIDLTTTPIEGSLTADDGTLRRFTGYMQLMTVLEAALQAARSADPVTESERTATPPSGISNPPSI